MKRLTVAALVLGVGLALTGRAGADTTTATVGDSAEAWYSTLPVEACTLPGGCPPVTVPAGSPYPSGTLHVAVSAGLTDAITYLRPDLPATPATSGIMTLPLATVSGSGNFNTSAAAIVACLATAPVTDGVAGDTSGAPPTDCKTSAAVQVGTSAFTLDLTKFLQAWSSGTPAYGIALLPDPNKSSGASWHVAFDGRHLSPPITSQLTLVSQAAPTPATVAPAAAPPQTSPPTTAAAVLGLSVSPAATVPAAPGSPPATAALALPAASKPAGAPIATGAPAASGQPLLAVASHGFQYPEVLLLPLAFLAGLVFMARLLTSDATPKRRPNT